jgi:hypothetical protein
MGEYGNAVRKNVNFMSAFCRFPPSYGRDEAAKKYVSITAEVLDKIRILVPKILHFISIILFLILSREGGVCVTYKIG